MAIFRLVRIALAMVLLAAPALAQPASLTGTVTYYERVALPRNAQLRVELVTLPDGKPVVGAAAIIPTEGQVPLSFSFNVRSSLAQTAYGLVAEIRSFDQVLFRNAMPVSVNPHANSPVQIVVQPVPRQPAPPLPTPPMNLIDTVWTATSIGGKPVTGSRPVTLAIAADQRATGNSGCNSYFAEASVVGNAISFGPAAATRMACAAELMQQENAYFAALAAVASFELDNDSLRLLDAAGIPLIGLVRTKE